MRNTVPALWLWKNHTSAKVRVISLKKVPPLGFDADKTFFPEDLVVRVNDLANVAIGSAPKL